MGNIKQKSEKTRDVIVHNEEEQNENSCCAQVVDLLCKQKVERGERMKSGRRRKIERKKEKEKEWNGIK